MPVTAQWHDSTQTTVLLQISDPWTITELAQAIEEGNSLMQSVNHTVYLVMDACGTNGIPKNVLSYFMNSTRTSSIPANQGAVIVIVQSGFLSAFVSVAKRVLQRYTQHMYIVNTLEAAEDQIRSLQEGCISNG